MLHTWYNSVTLKLNKKQKRLKMIPKQLKGVFSLSHNIKLYIPTTTNVNESVDTTEYVRKTLTYFGEWFGGATSHNAHGAWLSQDQGLVVEPVVIVESYATSEAVDANISDVLLWASTIKEELKQEAVSVEYDNKLYFI